MQTAVSGAVRAAAKLERDRLVAWLIHSFGLGILQGGREGTGSKRRADADEVIKNGILLRESFSGGVDIGAIVEEYLASGTFGDIYKVKRRGREEAMKVVRLVDKRGNALGDAQRIERLQALVDEADIMLHLGKNGLHPNLAAIRGIYVLRAVQSLPNQSGIYLFMDHVNGRTLASWMRLQQIGDNASARLALDIGHGLVHIRNCFPDCEFTHTDIKPANIMVTTVLLDDGSEVPGVARIIDFDPDLGVMTRAYASPQLLAGDFEYDTQHQWSWAAALLTMLLHGLWWSTPDGARRVLDAALRAGSKQSEIFIFCLQLCDECMRGVPSTRSSMHEVTQKLSLKLREQGTAERTDIEETPKVTMLKYDDRELFDLRSSISEILCTELSVSEEDIQRAAHHLRENLELAEKRGDEDMVATASSDLARLLHTQVGVLIHVMLTLAQGKLDEAQPYNERSLDIRRRALGEEHPDVGESYNNIAELLRAQGKYDEAKPYYLMSLGIRKRALGEAHPDVALSYNNLAELLRAQGKLDEAKPYYEQSLGILKKALGEEHPLVAQSYNNLAGLLHDQGKLDEARSYYELSLGIRRKALGEEHADVAQSYNNLALLLQAQGKLHQAEPYYRLSLNVRKEALGEAHPDVALSYNNLAELLRAQGKLDEAEPYYERSLGALKKALGEEHPNVALSYNNLALLLKAQGKLDEAKLYCELSLGIRMKALGEEHPLVAQSYNNLASLLRVQGNLDEATPYIELSLRILKKALGEEHPHVADSYNNLAELLKAQGKLDEAKPYYELSLGIRKRTLGEEHPLVAASYKNLASLLHAQVCC